MQISRNNGALANNSLTYAIHANDSNMSKLDELYIKILARGLLSLRTSARNGDVEQCNAESEYLHNIPSLIGEENINRHLYHVITEKLRYLDWVYSKNDKELVVSVGARYLDYWNELEKILGVDDLIEKSHKDASKSD